MGMDAAEREPEWSASANPAGRVELARLVPEANGPHDVTLEALLRGGGGVDDEAVVRRPAGLGAGEGVSGGL